MLVEDHDYDGDINVNLSVTAIADWLKVQVLENWDKVCPSLLQTIRIER